MARAQKRPGELGKVSIDQRGSRFRARTTIRDGSGDAHFLVGHGDTADAAHADLETKARAIWGGALSKIQDVQTFGDLAGIWFTELERRVARGRLKEQSVQIYRADWTAVLEPIISAVTIDMFDEWFVNNLLQDLEIAAIKGDTPSSYPVRARKILSMLAGVGLRNRLIDRNPVVAAEPLQQAEPTFTVFEPDQVAAIFTLAREWERPEGIRDGPHPNRKLLLDTMTIMLATSMRPGEALAIRKQDCFYQDGLPAIRVTGTIVTLRGKGTFRQDLPKKARQERGMFLPAFSLPTLQALVSAFKPNKYDLLLTRKPGTPYSVGSLDKLYRRFREQHQSELRDIGVDPEGFEPRSFRKTHATWLAQHAGIELAQKALGHADPRITSKHYIKPDDQVSIEASQLMQEGFGSAI